jgi:hypothetical protein
MKELSKRLLNLNCSLNVTVKIKDEIGGANTYWRNNFFVGRLQTDRHLGRLVHKGGGRIIFRMDIGEIGWLGVQ